MPPALRRVLHVSGCSVARIVCSLTEAWLAAEAPDVLIKVDAVGPRGLRYAGMRPKPGLCSQSISFMVPGQIL